MSFGPPTEPPDVYEDTDHCPECHRDYGDWDGKCRTCEGHAIGCDECKVALREDERIWLSSEEFTPKPGEIVTPEMLEKYDVLCEDCYDKLVKHTQVE